jgi:GNAT superfamily N-acetyltransferase
MLNLRITRGPLQPDEDEVIVREYSRLTGTSIHLQDFRRWVHQGPAGPAWHALLHADDGKIVGHASVIPLLAVRNAEFVSAAKAEYFFVHEDFRRTQIRGLERGLMPAAALLLARLYANYQQQAHGPVLISARDELLPLLRLIGCQSVQFPLHECLLVLDPRRAARNTPNLTRRQRAALFAAGLLQSAVSPIALRALSSRSRTRHVEAGTVSQSDDRVALFEDQASIQWRYPADQYLQVRADSSPDNYLIAKRNSSNGYMRVCQWRLSGINVVPSIVRALVQKARDERRIGVRWAVYGNGSTSRALVRTLRLHGFLCPARNRTVSFYQTGHDHNAGAWKMADSLFTFDL